MDKGRFVVLEWIKNSVSIFSTFIGIVRSFLFWTIFPSYLLPSWMFILSITIMLFVTECANHNHEKPITRFISTIISCDEANNRLLFRLDIQSVIKTTRGSGQRKSVGIWC